MSVTQAAREIEEGFASLREAIGKCAHCAKEYLAAVGRSPSRNESLSPEWRAAVAQDRARPGESTWLGQLRCRDHGHLPEEGCCFKGIICVDISEIAVGTLITERPPHRSVQAQFGHTAPTLGVTAKPLRFAVCAPARVTRLPGSESGACFAGSHSPWPPPLPPPAPRPVFRLCSSASPLLWHRLTSRDPASSATAPPAPGS